VSGFDVGLGFWLIHFFSAVCLSDDVFVLAGSLNVLLAVSCPGLTGASLSRQCCVGSGVVSSFVLPFLLVAV